MASKAAIRQKEFSIADNTMSTHLSDLRVTTAEQLAAFSRCDDRIELVQGELRMMSPAGGRHGQVAMRCGRLLANHVDEHQLGVVYAAETGFILSRDPDTVRAPDVAFVSTSRHAEISDPSGFVPFAPDLALEVISPNDTFSMVEEKAFAWLTAGTRLVLLVDPANESVHAYRSADDIAVWRGADELATDDVVPGWRVLVSSLFE
jgi:Uma2 family endonuclease